MQRDRLACPASGQVGFGEVVAAGERRGVVGAKARCGELERLLVKRDRFGRPTEGQADPRKIVASGERAGVIGPSFDLLSLSVSSCIAIASAVRPAFR